MGRIDTLEKSGCVCVCVCLYVCHMKALYLVHLEFDVFMCVYALVSNMEWSVNNWHMKHDQFSSLTNQIFCSSTARLRPVQGIYSSSLIFSSSYVTSVYTVFCLVYTSVFGRRNSVGKRPSKCNIKGNLLYEWCDSLVPPSIETQCTLAMGNTRSLSNHPILHLVLP